MQYAISLKVRPWESSLTVISSQPFQPGDLIIIDTEEGQESAIVESANEKSNDVSLPPLQVESPKIKIARKANIRDLNIIRDHRKKELEAAKICRSEVKKSSLPMKITGTSYSFDGGSIVFAFIADGRIDFRELVKNLSKIFQRSIRLHQIGARDEARTSGGYGICGRELCCRRFKYELPSIGSEMAKAQQIFRRGSERISGLCGRLMCCLSYEADQYREILEKMPKTGEKIKTQEGYGVVKEINPLSGSIRVELENGNIIRINHKDF